VRLVRYWVVGLAAPAWHEHRFFANPVQIQIEVFETRLIIQELNLAGPVEGKHVLKLSLPLTAKILIKRSR
jgi:hypothetical protein